MEASKDEGSFLVHSMISSDTHYHRKPTISGKFTIITLSYALVQVDQSLLV